MPTWRGQSNHAIEKSNYEKEIKNILACLDDNLNDNQKMYVNFHPILQGSVELDCYEHIEKFPDNVEKYDFLNSVDVLITDYSSVFFDFSITIHNFVVLRGHLEHRKLHKRLLIKH